MKKQHLYIFRSTIQPADRNSTMTKSNMLIVAAAAALAGSANAFSPAISAGRTSTSLNEDASFCRGYVGGEGPEPIPFSFQQTSENWDPLDFSGVSKLF